jgi:hypothetical protein
MKGVGPESSAPLPSMFVHGLIRHDPLGHLAHEAGPRRAGRAAKRERLVRDHPIEPMTLGDMRGLDVQSLDVSCLNCPHQAVLSADVGLTTSVLMFGFPHRVQGLRHRLSQCPAELEERALRGDGVQWRG